MSLLKKNKQLKQQEAKKQKNTACKTREKRGKWSNFLQWGVHRSDGTRTIDVNDTWEAAGRIWGGFADLMLAAKCAKCLCNNNTWYAAQQTSTTNKQLLVILFIILLDE